MQFYQQRRPRQKKEAIQRLSSYKAQLYRHRQRANEIAYNFRGNFLDHLAEIERKVDLTLRGLQNFLPWTCPDQGDIAQIEVDMVKIREEFTELSERTSQNVDQIVVDMDNLPGLEHYLQMPDLPIPAAPITAAEFAAITQFVARGPGHIAQFTNSTAFNPAMQTNYNQTAPHTGNQNIIRGHRRQPSQSTSDLISVVAPWIPQGYQPVAGPSNPPGLAPWIPQGYQPVAGPSNPPGRMHRYPSFQENYLPFAGGESAYTPDEYAASINSEHSSENSTTGLLRRHSKATRK